MTTLNEVADAVAHYHWLLTAAWTDETAHPDYRPLPKGMPLSYGQCIPTSIVLLRELCRNFPDEDMRLVSGQVLAVTTKNGNVGLRPIIETHAWIHWLRGSMLDEISVIDATADQAASHKLPSFVIATYDELLGSNIIYQPRKIYDSPKQYVTHLATYEPGIKQRVLLLQNRFDYQKSRGRD